MSERKRERERFLRRKTWHGLSLQSSIAEREKKDVFLEMKMKSKRVPFACVYVCVIHKSSWIIPHNFRYYNSTRYVLSLSLSKYQCHNAILFLVSPSISAVKSISFPTI